MTNKPMFSVERDLIERAVQAIINTSQMQPALNELRALIDDPEKDYVLINGMHFSHAEILEWREKACADMEKAAKHQGYPVNRLSYSQGDRRYVNGWNDACSHWEEHPSPVEAPLNSLAPFRATIEKACEQFNYCCSMADDTEEAISAYKGLRSMLDAWPADNPIAAPSAVFMPERESFDIEDLAGSFCQEALSFGINQDVFARCVRTTIDRTLSEVARLNGVAP